MRLFLTSHLLNLDPRWFPLARDISRPLKSKARCLSALKRRLFPSLALPSRGCGVSLIEGLLSFASFLHFISWLPVNAEAGLRAATAAAAAFMTAHIISQPGGKQLVCAEGERVKGRRGVSDCCNCRQLERGENPKNGSGITGEEALASSRAACGVFRL